MGPPHVHIFAALAAALFPMVSGDVAEATWMNTYERLDFAHRSGAGQDLQAEVVFHEIWRGEAEIVVVADLPRTTWCASSSCCARTALSFHTGRF